MYRKTTLANGLRIVSESIPYMSSVSLGIFAGTGSRHETPAEQGVSHFIEHLMFKGTHRRSAKDIAEMVDDVGGQLNAATDRENTCYYIKVLPEHLSLGMDILSDMLLNSKFADVDVEKERQVVLEEISLYEDSPDELIHDLHMNSLWPGHALGRNILGTRETIAAMNRQAIIDYRMRHYVPDNLVIAAAGNLTHEQLVELSQLYWADVSGKSQTVVDLTPTFVAARLLQEKDIEQLHVCLGTPGVAHDSPQYYASHVLNTILGGGVSSRLFQSIREDRGLAYSVCSYPSSFRDTGLMTIYAGVSPENSREVIEITNAILSDIRLNGVRPDEIKRAKEQLKAGLMFSMESSASRMSRVGRAEISSREYLSPEKLAAKVDAVSLEQLFELAQPLYQPETTCMTALGPVEAAGLV
ncbi:MAG: insulinase family protein [Negativicutes bacterium]|nr:insulinase family protein [Negativicutes bacterium]